MQSFMIPALGSQMYAMNGMVTRLYLKANNPGMFMGENIQYNGDGFYTQHFTARAVKPGGFAAYVADIHQHGRPLGMEALRHPLPAQQKLETIQELELLEDNLPMGVLRFAPIPDNLFHTILNDTASREHAGAETEATLR